MTRLSSHLCVGRSFNAAASCTDLFMVLQQTECLLVNFKNHQTIIYNVIVF